MTFRRIVLLVCCAVGPTAACRDTTGTETTIHVASVVVTPASLTLPAIGVTAQLTAEARDTGQTVLDGFTFTWTSSDSTKVRVSASGVVTAVAFGSATVTATAGGFSGSALVTVVQAVPMQVRVTPANPTLFAVGATRQMTADARDAGDDALTGFTFAWTSSDTAKVSVSASGLVTALAFGSATITASASGVAGSTTVSVTQLASTPDRITTGELHTCALTADGAAYCWGQGNEGQLGDGMSAVGNHSTSPVPVLGGLVFQSISAGGHHTCALTAAGAAYCWGGSVQAGDGGPAGWGASVRTSPVAVSGGLVFRTISAGALHTCGITTGGAAYCWGENYDGQLGNGTSNISEPTTSPAPTAVSGDLTFMAISAGDAHTCGLTVDGAAYCWGSNRYGQLGDGSGNDHATPVPVPGGLVFRAISAGGSHTCGVTTTGAAYCWGENESGQVGIGNSDYSNWTVRRPQMVVGGLVFRSIRAGGSHTCGLTTAGATYCWGDNRYGQLGDGTGSMKRASPTAVAGNVAFQAIASGYEHTCGLASGGAMYCWGDNASGQLGDGVEFGPHSSPVATAGNLAFQSVSAATEHTCGLTTGGGAYCWGTGRSAELGDSTLGSLRNSPVAVSGGLSFERVSAGPDHTCAVTAGGAAFCWGATDYHLMYDSSLVSSFSMVPAAVSGGLVFRAISAGGTHSCGLTAGGAAFCWGRDYYGQLGDGTSGRTAFANSPVAVSGGLVFQAISAGGTHTCGLTSDGAAYCWGDNTYGQLGDSTTTRHTSPVPVQGGLVFQSITAGSDLTFGITVDGAAYCWGSNRYGQLGDASGGHTTPVLVAGGLAFRAISVGGSHTCGVTTTGAAYCWGSNESGQVGTGTSGNTVVRNPVAVSGGLVLTAISAGSSHTCGLTVSGASYCWGNNFRYQLGDGTGFSTSPVAVTGGMAFSATAPEASQPLRR